jgi:hypothetical protein
MRVINEIKVTVEDTDVYIWAAVNVDDVHGCYIGVSPGQFYFEA